MVSNRWLHCPLRHIRRVWIQIRLRTRQIINSSVGRGIRRAWFLWSSYRQFVRLLTRQLFGLRCFTGIPHRRWHFRLRTSGRAFLRRLRRLSGLDRRILLRIDRHLHLHHHFAIVADVRARAGHGSRSHLHVADDRAGRVPEFRIIGRDLQHADVRIIGAIPPRLGGR